MPTSNQKQPQTSFTIVSTDLQQYVSKAQAYFKQPSSVAPGIADTENNAETLKQRRFGDKGIRAQLAGLIKSDNFHRAMYVPKQEPSLAEKIERLHALQECEAALQGIHENAVAQIIGDYLMDSADNSLLENPIHEIVEQDETLKQLKQQLNSPGNEPGKIAKALLERLKAMHSNESNEEKKRQLNNHIENINKRLAEQDMYFQALYEDMHRIYRYATFDRNFWTKPKNEHEAITRLTQGLANRDRQKELEKAKQKILSNKKGIKIHSWTDHLISFGTSGFTTSLFLKENGGTIIINPPNNIAWDDKLPTVDQAKAYAEAMCHAYLEANDIVGPLKTLNIKNHVTYIENKFKSNDVSDNTSALLSKTFSSANAMVKDLVIKPLLEENPYIKIEGYNKDWLEQARQEVMGKKHGKEMETLEASCTTEEQLDKLKGDLADLTDGPKIQQLFNDFANVQVQQKATAKPTDNLTKAASKLGLDRTNPGSMPTPNPSFKV